MSNHRFDVVIIGAGISGIGAAYYLQKKCPGKSYTILEGREALGGTWDLFRYPGIRSDSNMLTMAYSFKPWGETKTTAKGESIRNYVRETALQYGIEQHIRYSQHVTRAEWSSADATWTIQTQAGETYICDFLLLCSGYYSYKGGYSPEFKGRERFKGPVIHPQAWPEALDYSDKKIIVIGSGATAVTLIPELAKKAAQVVMLQRSPTYMRPLPDEDPFAIKLRKYLPERLAYRLLRWRTITLGQNFYRQARTQPESTKQLMIDLVRDQLPPDYDIATHFTPRYNPWDQRVCLVPDGDLFQAIRAKTASVVTDQIDTFTETGILLKSGQELVADIIVTATGLKLEVMGGIEFIVDHQAVNFANTVTYKGMMYSGVPNMVWTFGYINASWTLGVDLTGKFVCRLLNHMDKAGARQCTPRLPEGTPIADQPWIKNFSSGYIQRSLHLMPKQAENEPWINSQNHQHDKKIIEQSPVTDEGLIFEA
ncbi:MAG: NAD(P)/FAD-dependent oxidoreductase [Chloroflexota bacterium]